MKHRRTAVCALLLLVALLLAGCSGDDADVPVPEGDYVRIQVDGKTVQIVPLGEPRTVTLRQETGETNVIRITENGVYMESSNCHNQDCVRMGEVDRENWETRVNGAFIICLPNRVSVELAVKE